MEHRYSERLAVDLKAAIYRCGVLVGKGRIKNGSRYGLLLETDYTDVSCLQRLVIEVVVHLAPQQARHYELNTIVVRKYSEGLGLELEAIGSNDSLAMGELMDVAGSMKFQAVSLAHAVAM